jgi:hypothetical protein
MNIVGSSYFLRNLRNLAFFTLDFGKARKDPKTETFRKVDEFIVKYRTLYNRQLVKFGKIGEQIVFYEDLAMENNEYAIFKGDDIYEITFQQDQIADMENYILETLRKIDEAESEEQEMAEHNEKMVREVGGDNVWIARDDKNYGKSYTVDQTLSREEYRKAIKEKFKGTNK